MRKIDDLPKVKGYLSLREWAVLKKVSRAYAHMLVRSGAIRGLRVGEQIVIPEGTDYPASVAMARRAAENKKSAAARNSRPPVPA